jgi:hypothetical protein
MPPAVPELVTYARRRDGAQGSRQWSDCPESLQGPGKQRSRRLEFRRGSGAGQMDVNATYRDLGRIKFGAVITAVCRARRAVESGLGRINHHSA